LRLNLPSAGLPVASVSGCDEAASSSAGTGQPAGVTVTAIHSALRRE
jgi:hypothetical protein